MGRSDSMTFLTWLDIFLFDFLLAAHYELFVTFPLSTFSFCVFGRLPYRAEGYAVYAEAYWGIWWRDVYIQITCDMTIENDVIVLT